MTTQESQTTFPKLIIYIIETALSLAFIYGLFYYFPIIEVGAKHGFCYASNMATETSNRSQMNNILYLLDNGKITDNIFSPSDASIARKIKKRCKN